MQGHFVVCGLGQVGVRVALLLQRLGKPVVVLTTTAKPMFQDACDDAGIPVRIGDARHDRTLKEAMVHKAAGVLCCTSHDMVNIEFALNSRQINPKCPIIVRMFDMELARRMEATRWMDRAFAMSQISAPAFALASIDEEARGAFHWGNQKYIVLANPSGRGPGPMKELSEFRKLAAQKFGVSARRQRHRRKPFKTLKALWDDLPLILQRMAAGVFLVSLVSILVFSVGMKLSLLDSLYYVITTLTTVGYGDITPKESAAWVKLYACVLMLLGSVSVALLYSIFTSYVINTRFDEVLGRGIVDDEPHVIVVGLGNVGYRTILECQSLGLPVVAVDVNPETPNRSRLEHTPFINGDGRDEETLRRAGIASAVCVITSTSDDVVNLGISMTAKDLNPQTRVVTRLFDASFAAKAEAAFILDETLSASRVAAPSFVGAALYPDSLLSYIEGDHMIVVRPPAEGDTQFRFEQLDLLAETVRL